MRNTIKATAVLFLMLVTQVIFSQNPGDPPVDPGVAPINDYLIPMLLLGVALGYHLLRKKTEIVK